MATASNYQWWEWPIGQNKIIENKLKWKYPEGEMNLVEQQVDQMHWVAPRGVQGSVLSRSLD